MIKNIKRIAALFLVIVLCIVCVGCHKKDEIALKMSYGEYKAEFTSAFYACALVNADMEAQQRLESIVTAEQLSNPDFDYLTQKIDGKEYRVWVKDRALEICKQFFAYKVLCNSNNVATADQIAAVSDTAKQAWTYYEDMMSQNGVGFNTFKKFMEYEEYSTAYFNALYGEGGTKAVPKETLEKYLKEKCAYLNVLSENITVLDEKQVAEKKKTFEKYIERLKKGENFGKIYAEVNSQEYTKNENDKGIFNNNLATVWGAEDTFCEYVGYGQVSKLKNDEPTIITLEDSGYKYLCIVIKSDIMQEGNTQIDAYKDSIRHELKDEEFKSMVSEFIKKVKLDEVKRATSQFKVDKIVYPETAY